MTDVAALAKIHRVANEAVTHAQRQIEMRRAAVSDPRSYTRDITGTAMTAVLHVDQSPAQYAETFTKVAAIALAAAVAFTEEGQ